MTALPDDPVLLRRIIEQLQRERDAEVAALKNRLAEVEADHTDLQSRMDALLRRVFGRRTERVSAAQQLLFVDPDAAKALVEEP